MAATGPAIARTRVPAMMIAVMLRQFGWRRGRPIWASLKPCGQMICIGLAERGQRRVEGPLSSRIKVGLDSFVDPDRVSLGWSGCCGQGDLRATSTIMFSREHLSAQSCDIRLDQLFVGNEDGASKSCGDEAE